MQGCEFWYCVSVLLTHISNLASFVGSSSMHSVCFVLSFSSEIHSLASPYPNVPPFIVLHSSHWYSRCKLAHLPLLLVPG